MSATRRTPTTKRGWERRSSHWWRRWIPFMQMISQVSCYSGCSDMTCKSFFNFHIKLFICICSCRYAAGDGPSCSQTAAQRPHNAGGRCSESTIGAGYVELNSLCSNKKRKNTFYTQENTQKINNFDELR